MASTYLLLGIHLFAARIIPALRCLSIPLALVLGAYLGPYDSAIAQDMARAVLYERPSIVRDENSYFAVLGSFLSQQGATRHIEILRKQSPALSAGIYPPYGTSRYWTVVTAAYSSLEEASDRVKFARETGLQPDAFLWQIPHPPVEALHARPESLSETNSYFAVVGSFRSEQGAMQHLADISRRQIAPVAAVYPPYKSSKYWTVVTAAYANLEEARIHARYAREIGIQKGDAFVWSILPKRPGQPVADYQVHPPSVRLAGYPEFIQAPAPSRLPGRRQFVFIAEEEAESDANETAASIRSLYPGLQLAVFPPLQVNDPWRVAIGANLNNEQASEAARLARRLGLIEDPVLISLPSDGANAWRAKDTSLIAASKAFRQKILSCFVTGSVTLGEMRDCAGAWITPEAFAACAGESIRDEDVGILNFVDAEECIAIPDTAEAAKLIASLDPNEVLEVKLDSLYAVPEVEALLNCQADAAGDGAALQRCLLPTIMSPTQQAALECLGRETNSGVASCLAQGVDDPVVRGLVECVAGRGTDPGVIVECSELSGASASKVVEIQKCMEFATSEGRLAADCLPALFPDSAVRSEVVCLRAAGSDTREALKCFADANPSLAGIVDSAECFDLAEADPRRMSICLKGFVTGPAKSIAGCLSSSSRSDGDVSDCLIQVDEGVERATDILRCGRANQTAERFFTACADEVLDEETTRVVTCAVSLGDSKLVAQRVAECTDDAAFSGDTKRVLDLVECAQRGDGSPLSLLKCTSTDDPGRVAAVETAACLTASSGAGGLVDCVAPHLGGTGGSIVMCLAKQDPRNRDPLKCMAAVSPELAKAHMAYECARSAGDVASMIESCGDGVGDAKTRQVTACVVRAGSDRRKLAGCAAESLLPGEAGRLAGCAASSEGVTSFAVCAAAPEVNEEWRIAAECAVSTGGEPMSFATCTGGRLTVRELGKCITGRIGEDCFGPNNTIVHYYTNAWNDLTRGPSKSNEVIKALRALEDVGKGFEDAGQQVAQTFENVGRELERGVKNAEREVRNLGRNTKDAANEGLDWTEKRTGIKLPRF